MVHFSSLTAEQLAAVLRSVGAFGRADVGLVVSAALGIDDGTRVSCGVAHGGEDVLQIGDEILVCVTEIDEKGRVNVSAKDLLPKPEKKETKKEETK